MVKDKLLAYVAAFRGHSIESAGGLGGQCVDLVEVWAAVLRKRPIGGNAIDLWANASPADWSRVANGPTNFPQAGSVVVWHENAPSGIGALGHCAVVILAGPDWLLSFDQNWPESSKADLVMHSYLGCVGWLVPL